MLIPMLNEWVAAIARYLVESKKRTGHLPKEYRENTQGRCRLLQGS